MFKFKKGDLVVFEEEYWTSRGEPSHPNVPKRVLRVEFLGNAERCWLEKSQLVSSSLLVKAPDV